MILPAESSLYLKGLPAHFTKIVHSWQRQRQQERQCYRSCLPVISIRSDSFDTSTVILIRTLSRLGKQRPLLHFLYVRKCNVFVWINSLISLLDVDSSAVASNAKILVISLIKWNTKRQYKPNLTQSIRWFDQRDTCLVLTATCRSWLINLLAADEQSISSKEKILDNKDDLNQQTLQEISTLSDRICVYWKMFWEHCSVSFQTYV